MLVDACGGPSNHQTHLQHSVLHRASFRPEKDESKRLSRQVNNHLSLTL
jgi:hypothetical protein